MLSLVNFSLPKNKIVLVFDWHSAKGKQFKKDTHIWAINLFTQHAQGKELDNVWPIQAPIVYNRAGTEAVRLNGKIYVDDTITNSVLNRPDFP